MNHLSRYRGGLARARYLNAAGITPAFVEEAERENLMYAATNLGIDIPTDTKELRRAIRMFMVRI